jgi:hypothetical protein
MEVIAQACILREPEFVVRFEPVDLSVFVREEGDGTEDLAVVGEIRRVVVLGERALELWCQSVIRGISDTEDGDAVSLEPVAELPEYRRELRGYEDEIHGLPLTKHSGPIHASACRATGLLQEDITQSLQDMPCR